MGDGGCGNGRGGAQVEAGGEQGKGDGVEEGYAVDAAGSWVGANYDRVEDRGEVEGVEG